LKNYANILEMLQYLRQLCDHPALILYSFYNKTNKDTLRSFLINFAQYPDYKKILPSLEKVLENENVHVENFIEKYWVGSSKTNALVESLNKIKHITKSVIFSQVCFFHFNIFPSGHPCWIWLKLHWIREIFILFV
jgi:SNF2 family DNA or RNA helicase